MLERFLAKTEFSSYEDFAANYRVTVPQRFNFAWDVVDELARTDPRRTAIVWCDEKGAEATFSFGDMAEMSSRAASFFLGVLLMDTP